MWGLVKKDLLMIRGNLKLIAVMFVVFLLLAMGGNGNFSFIPAFVCIMLFMSTFSYDEYNQWDAYAATLPNGRRNVVKSKYLATLILVFFSIIITMSVCFLLSFFQKDLNREQILPMMLGSGVVILFLQAIMYPLIFKFGIEKSRIGIFVGIFGFSSLVAFLLKKGFPSPIVTFVTNYWQILLPLVVVLTFIGSYLLSQKIYSKKEF